jgi:hypothetical protein
MKPNVPHYAQGLPFTLAQSETEAPATTMARLMVALIAAAEAGNGEAQHRLGLACFRGVGVEQDLPAARRLQQAAAAQGIADAQFELSLLLAQGLGGPVDARGARRWEERAAKAGHPRACLNWASRLARARRPDFAEIARWYRRAAKAGSAEAAARLCKMHVAGQGVARSKGKATRWYTRAAELGYAWTSEAAEGAR